MLTYTVPHATCEVMSTVDKGQGVRHGRMNRSSLFNENESLFFICRIVFLICSLMGNQCSLEQRIRDWSLFIFLQSI